MVDEPDQPSLSLLLVQVAAERETIRSHAENLDAKAGVVLGFAGILVGLGATAQSVVAGGLTFRVGLAVAVAAAMLAAWAFLPRQLPVLELGRLRESNLAASEKETQLELLDTQIAMLEQAAAIVQHKGRRVQTSVLCLALAAILIVVGTMLAAGGRLHA